MARGLRREALPIGGDEVPIEVHPHRQRSALEGDQVAGRQPQLGEELRGEGELSRDAHHEVDLVDRWWPRRLSDPHHAFRPVHAAGRRG